MGFFSNFAEQRMSDALDRNGLARGTNSECCERCQCHVQDTKSSYLVCGMRQIYVGANQVCGDFARGASIYTMS